MAAWRWIFIIEGAITAVVSVGAAFLIVDWPEQCKFLSPEELVLLKKRLAADGGDIARMDTLNPYAYKLILSDWKIWLSSFVYVSVHTYIHTNYLLTFAYTPTYLPSHLFTCPSNSYFNRAPTNHSGKCTQMGIGITGYSTTFFMPTILKEFGWTAESAQVHTIPVYVVSGAGMLLAAWASDRLHHRYGFIMLGALLSTIGYGVLLSQQQHYATLSSSTKYGAVFLAALGGYIGTPIALAWLANNLSGHWKRAFGSGIQITVGNVVGIIASNIFVEHEAPTYRTGYGVALGLTWFGALTATVLALLLWRENRLRRDGKRDGRIATGTPKEEIDNMGDYHPAFRFTI